MQVWETDPTLAAESNVLGEYAAIWQAAEKIVFSTTLAAPVTARTRIERRFDPEAVRWLVEAAERDVTIGGPTLAVHAFRAGLVDEVHLYVMPYVTGGGKPCLPRGMSLKLELLEERRLRAGQVFLRYRTVT
jgi:dihydrofolate reductase